MGSALLRRCGVFASDSIEIDEEHVIVAIGEDVVTPVGGELAVEDLGGAGVLADPLAAVERVEPEHVLAGHREPAAVGGEGNPANLEVERAPRGGVGEGVVEGSAAE